MKTKEIPDSFKENVEPLKAAPGELSDEDLTQIVGGARLSESSDAYREWSDYLKSLKDSIRTADGDRSAAIKAAKEGSQKAINEIIADNRLTDMHKRLLLDTIERSF